MVPLKAPAVRHDEIFAMAFCHSTHRRSQISWALKGMRTANAVVSAFWGMMQRAQRRHNLNRSLASFGVVLTELRATSLDVSLSHRFLRCLPGTGVPTASIIRWSRVGGSADYSACSQIAWYRQKEIYCWRSRQLVIGLHAAGGFCISPRFIGGTGPMSMDGRLRVQAVKLIDHESANTS